MYVKRVRKKGAKDGKTTYDYLHLVQTSRTPKGPRQELLLNLGALPLKKTEWRVFAKEVEREIMGQEVIVKPRLNKRLKQCIEQTIHRLLEKQGKEIKRSDIEKEKGRDIQTIDTNSIRTKSHKSIGAEHVCHEVYKQLDIDGFLSRKGVSQRNRVLIEGLIVGRLLEPGSEKHTQEYLETTSSLYELIGHEECLPLTAYYRANDIIGSHKEDLEAYLSEKERGLFDLKERVILYDLTNTYIEGSGKKNDHAKYGHSKEKRYDCPLVTLGLVLTSDGFVKKSQLFPGNQAETKTLKGMVENLGIQHEQVIVMDAGIASKENLTWLNENNYRYLVCSRSQHQANDVTEYQTVKEYPDGTQVQMALKQEGDELFAYCKSDRKAHTEQAITTQSDQRFTEVRQGMKDGLSQPRKTKKYEKIIKRIGRLNERYPAAAKRYAVDVTKHPVTTMNVDDISWRKKETVSPENEGLYVLRSNHLDYSVDELWSTYRMLNHVEDSFRYMKSHLGFRPIYHHLTDRSDTHLFISVLAYRIWNIISFQLKKKEDHRNWLSIKQTLHSHMRYTLCYDTIQDNQASPTFIKQCSEPTEQQRSLYHSLNISTIPIPKKKWIRF
jgi:hypothetical protein